MSFWGRLAAATGAFPRADGGQSYTDAVFSAFDSIAGVNSLIRGTVAAVEIVAGRVERAFAGARVDGGPLAKRVLTPDVLGDIGRGLIERGESLHLLDLRRDGSAALVPAEWSWDVAGGANPDSWVIGASVPSPSGHGIRQAAYRVMAVLPGLSDALAAVSRCDGALSRAPDLGARRGRRGCVATGNAAPIQGDLPAPERGRGGTRWRRICGRGSLIG